MGNHGFSLRLGKRSFSSPKHPELLFYYIELNSYVSTLRRPIMLAAFSFLHLLLLKRQRELFVIHVSCCSVVEYHPVFGRLELSIINDKTQEPELGLATNF